jgi:hypothetical protein
MPRYPKPQPNKPFDGATSVRYCTDCRLNKVKFTVLEDCDLWIQFCWGRRPYVTAVDFYIDNFKAYAAFEIIQNIASFGAMRKAVFADDWGRHFEDGVLEIWHALGLPFYAGRYYLCR